MSGEKTCGIQIYVPLKCRHLTYNQNECSKLTTMYLTRLVLLKTKAQINHVECMSFCRLNNRVPPTIHFELCVRVWTCLQIQF